MNDTFDICKERVLANQGDVQAQNRVGNYYKITGEFEEAFRYFEMAAKQGLDVAQMALGTLYKEGSGVTESYDKAVIWFKKAAKQGNESAQEQLKTWKETW